MNWKLATCACLASALLVGCSSKEDRMEFAETQDSQFRPGQVWSYKTRPGEEASTVTVCKVEAAGRLGTVVHVSVAGVKIKSPQNKDGQAKEISHLLVAKAALERSVTTVVKENQPLPDYLEGYKTWRKAVEGGKGGVWSITIAEAISTMESALNK